MSSSGKSSGAGHDRGKTVEHLAANLWNFLLACEPHIRYILGRTVNMYWRKMILRYFEWRWEKEHLRCSAFGQRPRRGGWRFSLPPRPSCWPPYPHWAFKTLQLASWPTNWPLTPWLPLYHLSGLLDPPIGLSDPLTTLSDLLAGLSAIEYRLRFPVWFHKSWATVATVRNCYDTVKSYLWLV